MKILLVEDNKKLSDTIKEGLEQEGFAVDCLYDGATAERRISDNRDEYDLVILDRMLPEKEGVEVCLAWRRADIVVPVLMLTALGMTDDKVFGLDAGADDYLAKPFEFNELIARIHALLRRPKDLSSDIITVSDITMDVIGRKVKFKSKDLPLTLKEFMVLEYLMRNVGKVITRDTLYSHAWDFADSAFSNTIDVHIKNLRKKLHDNGKFIQTIRGVGYKMEV
jgi:DNA-binding response OmpR family regulator